MIDLFISFLNGFVLPLLLCIALALGLIEFTSRIIKGESFFW